jgi:hypothetical protein
VGRKGAGLAGCVLRGKSLMMSVCVACRIYV